MDSSKISAFLIANQGNVSSDYLPLIKQKLEALDDNRAYTLMALDLKSPFVALLLSIFVGSLGIDRFYIGDTTNGIIKLITGVIVLPTISVITFGFGAILYLGYMIDWFLIMGATKKKNAEKLMMFL